MDEIACLEGIKANLFTTGVAPTSFIPPKPWHSDPAPVIARQGENPETVNWRCLLDKVRTFFAESPAIWGIPAPLPTAGIGTFSKKAFAATL